MDGQFSRLDGIILVAGFFAMVYWMISLGMRSRKTDPMLDEFEAEIPKAMPMQKAILLFLFGLVMLLVGSRLLINGAVDIAHSLGVSDLIIGLTIVAIGTSLPELAASVVSALKKEHDIAIGNVIGSNMFNLLAVLGLPGLIHPGAVPGMVLQRDFPYMIGLTMALFIMAYGFRGPGRVNRIEGGILVTAFVAYQVLLYFTESSSIA
jgi:cation:H+ antiporter